MRSFLRISIPFVGFLVIAHFTLAQARVDLSLPDVFDRIDAENLELLISREVVRQALQSAARERAALLPTVGLRASQDRDEFNRRFNARITADVPLFDPVAWADWKIAQFEHEIAELNVETVRQEIYELVATLFFTYQRDIARLAVIDANLARDNALVELATSQYEAGVATQLDVTRAEVLVAQDERDRLEQETTVLLTGLELKRFLRIDLDDPITVAIDSPAEPDASEVVSLTTIDQTLNNVPAFREAQHVLERNQFARRAARWERLPTVVLSGDWGYGSDRILDGTEQEEWMVGISLDVPIFDGLRIRSNRLAAEAAIRAQELALESIRDQVSAAYRLSVQSLRSRFDQIAAAEKAVALSTRELEFAEARFREGVADNREVIEAQANLAQANDDRIEAIYSYNLSRLAYARARGNVRLMLLDH